jgi:glycosyltransferase involved in cell wall biosynthesis
MWMNNLIKESFLNVHQCHVIHNGIDLNQFNIQSEYCINELRKKLGLLNEYVLLGVASVWNDRKGLLDFVKLSKIIPHNWKIVLVGLTDQQISMIPDRIIGIKRTENQQQLSTLYSLATVFVNPTYEDTYPTTNLESMACGTPVITYRTGGSPESVTDETGYVVEQGDVAGIFKCTNLIIAQNSSIYKTACRKRAEEFFNKSNKFDEYIKLYESLIKRKF